MAKVTECAALLKGSKGAKEWFLTSVAASARVSWILGGEVVAVQKGTPCGRSPRAENEPALGVKFLSGQTR